MALSVIWSSRITYNEENVKYNVPPALEGIYRLLIAQEGGYGAFYVGQTDNLQRRLLEHLSDEEENDCIKNGLKDTTAYFRFALLDGENDRLCAESYMYRHYDVDGNGPPCNKKEPEVEPCEINLD